MSQLLESSDDDETGEFKINDAYATSYNRFREKEQFQKLKDKYGEEAAKKALNVKDDENDSDEDESSSSEDETAEALTDKIEKDFFKTMSYLKNKDPKIYDGKVTFFQDDVANKTKSSKAKDKPMYLGDMERKIMLEKGGTFEEIDDIELKQKAVGKSYVDEMQDLKESFKNAQEDLSDDDDALLLKPKHKTKEDKLKEDKDYKKWLAGQKVEIKDETTKKDLSGLREFWTNKDLNKDEQFLRDYILNKKYLDNDDEMEDDTSKYDDEHNDDLSEDEKNLEQQEEFEHKYNFRFEEPDQEFIKRYPRTMQLKDTMRKKDNRRTRKREEVKARKLVEKEKKREELKQLKALKRKEIAEKIQKLQKVVGEKDFCPFKEQDIDDDFDPVQYDKRMAEVFESYDETGKQDEEKPEFSDLSDSELEEELEVENWDEWTGANGDKNKEGLDGADNQDKDITFRKAATQKELIESTSNSKANKKRKSKFAEALEKKKPMFDPNDKTFEQYFDEYYKLDYEDLIGDIPCRFRYRQVKANNFGLTTDEILSAPDRELNAWSSLKKTCQFRDDADELRDIELYKSKANNVQLKKKIMPSLFSEEGSQKALEAEKEKKASKSKTRRGEKRKNKNPSHQSEDGNEFLEEEDYKGPKDQISISKSKSKTEESLEQKTGEIEDISKCDKKSTRRKKKRKNLSDASNNDPGNNMSHKQKRGQFYSAKSERFDKHAQQDKKKEINAEIKMSDRRLESYGIAPNTFKRKKIKEKYREKAN